MPLIKQNLSSTPLRVCKDAGLVNVTLNHIPLDVIVTPATSTPVVIGDANYNTSTPATYYTAGRVLVTNSISTLITCLDPDIATISEDGTITRISEGIARFTVTESGVTKQITVDLRNKTDGATVNEFVSVQAGALAEHLSLQVDSRIDGSMTMAANGLLYSTQDHAGQGYTRNPNFWGNGIDLTCISPWNSNAGARKAGTAITPRHIVNAAHYEYGLGTVVRFVTADNQVVNRTVVGKKRHPDYTPYYPDLTIYTLDSDLPASITPCKVMPSDWDTYITEGNLNGTRPAALGLDQEEKGLIIDLASERSFRTSTDPTRLIFDESKIIGDSGNPAFVIVDGELVLVTAWTFGGAGSGTSIADHIADLNQMISDADAQAGVSTGYTVTESDFSSFPTFSNPT